MAGETIFACRYAKFPTNAIAGVTHARLLPDTVERADQGAAGSTGPADGISEYNILVVELYGKDFAALTALIGATKANLIVGAVGAAGASEKHTIKNVIFLDGVAPIDIPAKDEGGKLAAYGIRGLALWGSEDSWATMLVAASDA